MQTQWKKYFVRHGLFTYSRDSLLFFVNLFAWSQEKNLKAIALFNIVYLFVHTCMFFIALPAIKKGKGQLIMKSGMLGMATVLATLVLLEDRTVDYIYFFAFFIGVTNGMYWLVNHIESLDLATNSKRTSFFSYRMATQGIAKLAVPGVGWLMFSLFGNSSAGYSAVFAMAFISMLLAWSITTVVKREETKLKAMESIAELRRTKYFGLLQLNAFVYGVSIRSALAVILLPFLIFQVVEKESSFSMIQTLVEAVAILAAVFFAGHKKNTDYISKLFLIGGLATMMGLVALFISLNITTYIVFAVTFVIALSTLNIGLGTMSNNYALTIKDYNKHRMEYIAVREPAALAGFISGYIFVYFNPNLTIYSIRPLLVFTMIATVLNVIISRFLWRHVQVQDRARDSPNL